MQTSIVVAAAKDSVAEFTYRAIQGTSKHSPPAASAKPAQPIPCASTTRRVALSASTRLPRAGSDWYEVVVALYKASDKAKPNLDSDTLVGVSPCIQWMLSS